MHVAQEARLDLAGRVADKQVRGRRRQTGDQELGDQGSGPGREQCHRPCRLQRGQPQPQLPRRVGQELERGPDPASAAASCDLQGTPQRAGTRDLRGQLVGTEFGKPQRRDRDYQLAGYLEELQGDLAAHGDGKFATVGGEVEREGRQRHHNECRYPDTDYPDEWAAETHCELIPLP